MTRDLRPAAARFQTVEPGRVTRHSFSFGSHYDPGNLRLGPLVCHNDDLLEPGAGYADHPHSGVEIVTWVLSGALLHRDSAGGDEMLRAGWVQVQSTGEGIVHSEVAAIDAGPTRYVQAWLVPDAPGGQPARATVDAAGLLADRPGPLQPVAAGTGPAPVPVRCAGATLRAAALTTGGSVVVPPAPRSHLFLALGSAVLDGVPLAAGDAVRLAGEPAARLVATEPGLLMVWSFEE